MAMYKPAPGLKVRAKNGPMIPPEGMDIDPNDPYYRRHIKDQALVAVEALPKKQEKTSG